MATVLSKRVLGSKHRYDEIEPDVSVRGRALQIPPEFFQVKKRQAEDMFKRVVGNSSRSAWWSLGVDRINTPVADLVLISFVCGNGDYAALGKTWLGALADVQHQLILRETSAPQVCYMGLGCVGDSCVLLWPMHSKIVDQAGTDGSKLTYYEPDVSVTSPVLRPMVDLSMWRAVVFEPRSPASSARLHPGLAVGRRLLAVRASDEAPLLEVAARHGFWSLGHPFLQALCKLLQLDNGHSASLFDTLLFLLRSVLPDMSEHELLDICGRRVARMAGRASKESYEDLLELEGSTEFLTKDDVTTLRKETEKATDQTADVNEFRTAVVRKRAALPKRPGESRGSGGGSGGSRKKLSLPKRGVISHEQVLGGACRGLEEGFGCCL